MYDTRHQTQTRDNRDKVDAGIKKYASHPNVLSCRIGRDEVSNFQPEVQPESSPLRTGNELQPDSRGLALVDDSTDRLVHIGDSERHKGLSFAPQTSSNSLLAAVTLLSEP